MKFRIIVNIPANRANEVPGSFCRFLFLLQAQNTFCVCSVGRKYLMPEKSLNDVNKKQRTYLFFLLLLRSQICMYLISN